MEEKYDIEDNEVRIVGNVGNEPSKKHKKIAIIVAATIAAIAICLVVILNQTSEKKNNGSKKTTATETDKIINTSNNDLKPYISTADTTVNNIELQILTPVNTTAELHVGPIDTTNDILLATQAADLGRGKHEIIGAFVYAGEPLSWGLSKKGFCAIINDTITIGVTENSPLFEQATETGGYFFRQYPAVKNGKMVENNPKNASTRRALCIVDNKVCIITTPNRVTMNEFSQALADMGTSNAIFLVGSSANGWYRDTNNNIATLPNNSSWSYNLKNINYIVFKR